MTKESIEKLATEISEIAGECDFCPLQDNECSEEDDVFDCDKEELCEYCKRKWYKHILKMEERK